MSGKSVGQFVTKEQLGGLLYSEQLSEMGVTAVQITTIKEIERKELELDARDLAERFASLNEGEQGVWWDYMRLVEKPLLERALSIGRGNLSHTAKLLGINRATLRQRLRLYEIIY